MNYTDRSTATAAAAFAALTAGVQGPGRGPLGIGVTGGGRGFWEMSGDKSRAMWGMYTGGPMRGMAPWTDVRQGPTPRMPMGSWGGAMVGSMADGSHSPQWAGREVPRYDRAGRPIKGRLPPGRPSPVLVPGETREPVYTQPPTFRQGVDPSYANLRQPPTLGVPRRGVVGRGYLTPSADKHSSGLYAD